MLVVAQIIDSLNSGGAEMMSVLIANAVADTPDCKSLLIVARGGGPLREQVSSKVQVYDLQRTGKIDLRGLLRLVSILKKQKVSVVHAHGSSVVYAAMAGQFVSFALVWHDHFGKKIANNGSRSYPYRLFSRQYRHVFCVSEQLLESNRRLLKCPKAVISYLPNFPRPMFPNPIGHLPEINGSPRLVHLANLREQKDHFTLINALQHLLSKYPGIKILCIGGELGTPYHKALLQHASFCGVQHALEFTGPVAEPFQYLLQADIGLLSSKSEGLPLALLEYGMVPLPVVVTKCGKCPDIIGEDGGIVVPPEDAEAFARGIDFLLQNKTVAKAMAETLKRRVLSDYSQQSVMHRIMETYRQIINRGPA